MDDQGQYYEARQHLNLSQLAYDVIDQDRFAFLGKPSFAGMLNRVFEMYRDYADAAIDLACESYEAVLKDELAKVPEDTAKTAVMNELLSAHRQKLIITARSYPRECKFKFQLNRENYAFISAWRDTEDVYDGVPGKFIKAVIEEYARKPLVERESIVFRDLIDQINECIESHRQINITLQNGARYTLKPFCVCTDQGYNYHYLAGFAKGEDGIAEEKPVSFRVSNIASCRKIAKSGRLTDSQKREIQEKIRVGGVQFLLQDPEIIRVKLSTRGKNMYDSQAHLRPPFINRSQNPDGTWVYDFSCTPIQARFYFFKFGADAEILQPEELRKEFRQLYAESLAVYTE